MAAVMWTAGCASASSDESGPMPESLTLTGAATYRERIALPPEAVLTVTVEDVSLADAPAVTLAQTQSALEGRQVPIPFALTYSRSAVTPDARYAARARVTVGDRLLFITTENNPVDALNPAPIELMMTSVPAAPDVALTETYWKITGVDGQPVVVTDQAREPSLVLHVQDGRFSGSGGVNRLMGDYTLDGQSLSFGNAGSTMMAGPPEAMQQEQAIVTALGRVRGFSISGDQLTLVDDSGRPVLQAVAAALR
jgi:putative lipoprotein